MDRSIPADEVLWRSSGTLFEGEARAGIKVLSEMTAEEARFFRAGGARGTEPQTTAATEPVLVLRFIELTRAYPRLALFSAPTIVFERANGGSHRYADDSLGSGMPGKNALDQLVEMQAILKRANPAISFTRG